MARNKRSDRLKVRRESAFRRMEDSLRARWSEFRKATDGEHKISVRRSMDRMEDSMRNTGRHLGHALVD